MNLEAQNLEIRKICIANNLSRLKEYYLRELLECSNLDLESEESQQNIANRLRCNINTVKSMEKELNHAGIIVSKKRRPRQTNIKTFVALIGREITIDQKVNTL